MGKKRLGVTYAPALEERWSGIKKLADAVEIANLSYLQKAEGRPWTYHLRQNNPFERKYGQLNMLRLQDVKIALEKSKQVILNDKPEIISVHLGHSALELTNNSADSHSIAKSDLLSRDEVMRRLLESLDYLLEFTEAIGVPFAVENLDYHHFGGAYEYVCEPDFINEIFERNKKLYWLLDIAHAEVSAVELFSRNHRHSLTATMEYLKKLPLGRIIEIHINSPIWKNGNLFDMHLPITRLEKKLLKDLLLLPNLSVINLECEIEVEKQLKSMRRIF